MVLAGALFLAAPSCQAEIAEGQALIDASNPQKARSDAIQDAMRTYVEKKVGVHVKSSTVTEMGAVVSDRILAESDGYVQINKIVSEHQNGGIYSVTLDLTASDQKIQSAVETVAQKLQLLQEGTTSRSGVVVAVTGRGSNGAAVDVKPLITRVSNKLKAEGFQTYGSDEAQAYLDKTTDLDDTKVSAEVRRLARNERDEANAILRGTIKVAGLKKEQNFYAATVHVSFELIGFSSNATDSYDDYFTAVAADGKQAVSKAEDIGVAKALSEIAKSSLLTVQSEMRGGSQHFKMTMVVSGITDRNAQQDQVIAALQALNCRVIRSSFTSNGNLKIFMEANGYSTQNDLDQQIRKKLPALHQGNTDEAALGSQKLYYSF